jgi:hypothetical protein
VLPPIKTLPLESKVALGPGWLVVGLPVGVNVPADCAGASGMNPKRKSALAPSNRIALPVLAFIYEIPLAVSVRFGGSDPIHLGTARSASTMWHSSPRHNAKGVSQGLQPLAQT